MTTADAKVELVARALLAHDELNDELFCLTGEPERVASDFARTAITALEASSHMRTEAITPEMRFAARQTGDVANQMSSSELDAVYAAMQAARPIAPVQDDDAELIEALSNIAKAMKCGPDQAWIGEMSDEPETWAFP
jgi:predicted trehalose synthase